MANSGLGRRFDHRRWGTWTILLFAWSLIWSAAASVTENTDGGIGSAWVWGTVAVWSLFSKLVVMRVLRFAIDRVRFVTFHDFLRLTGVSCLSLGLTLPLAVAFGQSVAVVSVVEGGLVWATMMALSAWPRAWKEWRRWRCAPGDRTRVLIWGCSGAEELLLRSLHQHPENRYHVVGLIGGSADEIGVRVGGVPIVATVKDWKAAAVRLGVDELFVVSGTQVGDAIRRASNEASAIKVKLQVLPSYHQLLSGDVHVTPRPVSIEDLLQRKSIELHSDVLSDWIDGRRVLITGAAGSIGSEIVRQILAFQPEQVILVDRSEHGIYQLRQEHGEADRVVSCLADASSRTRMVEVFSRYRPHIVFHAAAYKHVPILEDFPQEAVKNIIGSTVAVARAAERSGVESLVLVSTDKAVAPTSVMGACKRVAERYLQAIADQSPCRMVAVRFGNVLDSAGSVVPRFREQIAKGEPITVTDPRMTRFFMTIPEAAQLVLHAGAMGSGGEIFVLRMGQPVRIVDLARELIRLSGLVPDVDVPIRFCGLRPGEKLEEQLADENEMLGPTSHPEIDVVQTSPLPDSSFCAKAEMLIAAANDSGEDGLVERITQLVPEFQTAGHRKQDCLAAA